MNSVRTLAVIRMAMTSGIIAFASAVYYMRHSANAPDPAGNVETLRRMALGAAVLSVIGIGILRQRLAGAPVERRNAMAVVGWAIGEFGAIAGIACYFVSGVEATAAPGMLAYVIGLIMFPIRRQQG